MKKLHVPDCSVASVAVTFVGPPGLPLSRLYARYLGGALDLVSLPGYGTHAYVNLPRVQSQQVEVVPAPGPEPSMLIYSLTGY